MKQLAQRIKRKADRKTADLGRWIKGRVYEMHPGDVGFIAIAVGVTVAVLVEVAVISAGSGRE